MSFGNISQFVDLLQKVKTRPNGYYQSLCPAHDDHDQSLSVWEKDGWINVKCFANCQKTDILKRLNLTNKDLRLNDGSKPKGLRQGADIIYPYHNLDGTLLYEVVRKPGKNFRQRRPDSKNPGEYIWNLEGIKPVIYNWPEVAKGIAEGELIFIFEGEKDCHNAKRKLKVIATSNNGGAGNWTTSLSDMLVGGDVVICPDMDKAGLKHAYQVYQSLLNKAKRARILYLPNKDISDWLNVHDPTEFDELVLEARDWNPAEAAKYEDAPTETKTIEVKVITNTDTGNAVRLVCLYGSDLRFCYETKKWYIWNGKYWESDMGAVINQRATVTVKNIYREAADEPDTDKAKALARHAMQSESNHKILAMINRAESQPGIPVEPSELDTDNWLLNCKNGTIDLRTGELLAHTKGNLITQMIPTEYDTKAECPLWDKFLDRVTKEDTELIVYLQKCVGYSLTGDTQNELVFFVHGDGQNGKSTFVHTIRVLMGSYGHRVNPDIFMTKGKNTGGPKEGLANLKGKRYVVGSEIEEGRKFAMAIVKASTGAETITADRKYEHEYEYQPTHKLWLSGNYKPEIRDTSVAAWRRLKVVPFHVHIPDREKDEGLKAKLKEELPGILAWAVRGCLAYQKEGMPDPQAVLDATASYRHEQDILGNFVDECCILASDVSIAKSDFKAALKAWCMGNNFDIPNQHQVMALLPRMGPQDGVSSDGKRRVWKGIRQRTDNDPIIIKKESDKIDISDKTTISDKILSLNHKTPIIKETRGKFTENGKKLSKIVSFVKNKSGKEFDLRDLPPDYPPYPSTPCRNCGSDLFWAGSGGWQCCTCRPRPPEDD